MNVAIIGTGFIGNAHATAIKNSKSLELAAICDVNEQAGQKVANEFSCAFYKDAEQMLKEAKVDIVDICLPTFLHEKYVLLAAEYKKSVICEKPITLTMESMDRMINATKAAGVKFMTAQVVRFWPEYVEIKKLYDAGNFGEVKMVYANRLAQHPNWAVWQKDPQKSGGGLFDLHLHDIDYLVYLLGAVKTVYAVGWKNDTGCWNHVMTSLTFTNGASAVAEGAYEMTEKYPFTMSLRIVGETKTADYKLIAGFNLEDVGSSIREAMLYQNGSDPEKIQADTTIDAYQAELEYFADCVATDKQPEVVLPESSREVLQVMLAIQSSLESGKAIQL
ncbi:MAG: Gfo/Idh/MocA family oxidoreductase [Eubacteriales bacterium]